MKAYVLAIMIMFNLFDSQAANLAKKYPMVIAHRGGAQLKLENTIPALRHAFLIGADGIEVDVQLTKDNQVVVYHDKTLNPDFTTDSNGHRVKPGIKIEDLTLEELKSYNLGDIDVNSKYAKEHPDIKVTALEKIPTIVEVLDLVPVGKAIFIELKIEPDDKKYKELVEKVVYIIKRREIQNSAMVISFSWRSLDYIHEIAPDIYRCYLTHDGKAYDPRERSISNIPTTLATKGHPYWGANYSSLNPKQFESAREMKIGMMPWSANDSKAITDLIDKQVVAVTTDRPDIMIGIIKKKEEDLMNAFFTK